MLRDDATLPHLVARAAQVQPTGPRETDLVICEQTIEEVYLHDFPTVAEAVSGLERYFRFYNHEQPHQALGPTFRTSA